ncbi:MAG: hypothetical protein PHO37_15680 [Kiritimatiellae bacterium]|nr:hypothetical protein [Kiritimatiellia bacterium]
MSSDLDLTITRLARAWQLTAPIALYWRFPGAVTASRPTASTRQSTGWRVSGSLRLALHSTGASPARSRPAALQLRPDNHPAGACLAAYGSHCTLLALPRRGHGQPPYSFDQTIGRLARVWQLVEGCPHLSRINVSRL